MNIEGQIVLVTGSNRGIGRQFVEELLARGAAKVYATARRPEGVDAELSGLTGVAILPLDITDQASVDAVATAAQDVTLLINNAGVSTGADLVAGDLALIRREMDTHFFGTLSMVRAFAPILRANGGGGIVNVLSALSWFNWIGAGAYGAAKAAGWAMTNGVRLELAAQGTLVTGVHLGAADTEMMAGYDGPLLAPRDVVIAVLDGVEAGSTEVVVDEWSATAKASLALAPSASPFYDGTFNA